MIDTHTPLDGEEFRDDLPEVIQRAKDAGVGKMFVPAIDYKSSVASIELARQYAGVVYPMVGLHPEEVKENWREELAHIKSLLPSLEKMQTAELSTSPRGEDRRGLVAIGEVGLDYYWSREFEQEQLEAFEEQVRWSVETRLPLMIHCRKAQNEMVAILKRYKDQLPGGVFHCFTGNELEAKELLQFERFVLGIGGVLTFKKSHLPEVLPAVVPLDRIVLETDSPYMAPVPMRGKRNEPAFVVYVMQKLAESYQVSPDEVERRTNETVTRVFGDVRG